SNKIRQTEIEILAEIERILRAISLKFKEISKEIIKNNQTLIRLDTIFAKAKYSIHLHAQRPDIVEDKIIELQAMRHPLLVEFKKDVVANDFEIGREYSSLLITGSNTGGKTVVLKSAGLMVLMTKAGMHIPCLGGKIHLFSKIFCDISTEQSLEQGFSTFSAHIRNIAQILDEIDEDSLILLDELGSGTDPEEGSALSYAILDFIKQKNATSVITTHLGELKLLKYKDNYFQNATVTFNIETLKPEYKLIIGISGTSNAIDISSELGLNSKIIEKAKTYLNSKQGLDNSAIKEIEKVSIDILHKEKLTSKTLEDAQKTSNEAKEKLNELKKNKKKSLEGFKKKFQSKFDSAREEIKEIVEEVRKEKSIKVAARAYNRLNRLEALAREEFSNTTDELAEKYKELNLDNLKIGQNVLIKKLDQVVILDSLPDKKGTVWIKIGNIRSKIPFSRLAYTDKKIAPHLKKVEVHFDNVDNLLSRLDLRGMRVDEALEYLDNKLDKANLRGLNQITVIHGHGTGALKQAIRRYLENSPYVAKFRTQEFENGDDGTTVVDLM
ncbi:Smr/MutS family protein, partial [bacterium]|nr:Smr/MutS family protein [bacterium]